MNKKEVLQYIDRNTLKLKFTKLWDKNPRTMYETMKYIVLVDLGAKITTGTANALLHEIEA